MRTLNCVNTWDSNAVTSATWLDCHTNTVAFCRYLVSLSLHRCTRVTLRYFRRSQLLQMVQWLTREVETWGETKISYSSENVSPKGINSNHVRFSLFSPSPASLGAGRVMKMISPVTVWMRIKWHRVISETFGGKTIASDVILNGNKNWCITSVSIYVHCWVYTVRCMCSLQYCSKLNKWDISSVLSSLVFVWMQRDDLSDTLETSLIAQW